MVPSVADKARHPCWIVAAKISELADRQQIAVGILEPGDLRAARRRPDTVVGLRHALESLQMRRRPRQATAPSSRYRARASQAQYRARALLYRPASRAASCRRIRIRARTGFRKPVQAQARRERSALARPASVVETKAMSGAPASMRQHYRGWMAVSALQRWCENLPSFCDRRALRCPPLSCRTSPPHGGRSAASARRSSLQRWRLARIRTASQSPHLWGRCPAGQRGAT